MSAAAAALRSVAYQGEPGAFGEEAVAMRWGGAAEAVPVPTFRAVVAAVAEGRAALGVLPLENSIAGPVTAAHEALAAGGVVVVDEVRLTVRQCLLAPPGSTLDALRSVESHPVALAQCGAFLGRHPWLRPRAVEDTAGAARAVAAAGDRRRGAIASRLAAARYGLDVLAADVHDRADNETRFVIVARAAGADRW